jgi:hypothetical protein
MNIFYLDKDPNACAKMHLDKHCVKMILEYAQLLSTAHRYLDGVPKLDRSETTGRKRTNYILPDDRNDLLYRATHINHPSAVWVRQSFPNYIWLAELLEELCKEYTHRYDKIHKVESTGLMQRLKNQFPRNLPSGKWSEPTPAMPEDYKVLHDSIASYHNYYLNDKVKMARWTNRNMPDWFITGINTLYEDVCHTEHKPKLNRTISMPLKYANIHIS